LISSLQYELEGRQHGLVCSMFLIILDKSYEKEEGGYNTAPCD